VRLRRGKRLFVGEKLSCMTPGEGKVIGSAPRGHSLISILKSPPKILTQRSHPRDESPATSRAYDVDFLARAIEATKARHYMAEAAID
jgi:hypothetical protein